MAPLGSRPPSGLRSAQAGAGAVLGGWAILAGRDEKKGGAVSYSTRGSMQQR